MDKDTVDAKIEETEGVSTEGKSSHPNLDQDNFHDDRDNLIETVEIDEVGGMDTATGGARTSETTDKVETKPDTEDKDTSDKDDKTETDKTDKVDDAKTDTKTDDTKPDRYDKDPAWQRIIRERDAALKENAELKSKQAPEETKDFIDLSTKTEEEIAEWMNDDPVGFAENQRKQIAHKVRQDLKAENQEKETQSKLDKTFSEYSSNNPDNDDKTGFVQMWESGKIQDFMEQNPGHTAISAHMTLTAETRSKSIDKQISEAVAKEVAKIRTKLEKENKARVRTDGLGSGPAYTPGDEDDELKDTKSKGGLISVLANRSAKRARQAG